MNLHLGSFPFSSHACDICEIKGTALRIVSSGAMGIAYFEY